MADGCSGTRCARASGWHSGRPSLPHFAGRSSASGRATAPPLERAITTRPARAAMSICRCPMAPEYTRTAALRPRNQSRPARASRRSSYRMWPKVALWRELENAACFRHNRQCYSSPSTNSLVYAASRFEVLIQQAHIQQHRLHVFPRLRAGCTPACPLPRARSMPPALASAQPHRHSPGPQHTSC